MNRRIAAALIESIQRYRRNRPAWTVRIECRFQPTCSHFAEQALRERALPVALLMIVGRLLRCNPLARRVSPDPVRRKRRLRPNSLRTILSIASLTGLVWLMAMGIGWGQNITGSGCTASINGRAPASLPEANPLVVTEGQNVRVDGTVPANVAQLPPDQITSTTSIEIVLVEDIFKITRDVRQGTGPAWGGSVSVDPYLRFGGGLYHVTGIGSGTPGWSCQADGYIKLDAGNPLTKPVGAAAMGVTAVAGVTALASTRTKDQPSYSADTGPTADEVKGDFGRDVDSVLGIPPKPDPVADVGASMGCGLAMLTFFVGREFAEYLFYGGGAVVSAKQGRSRRVWVKAHPVAGFFSGLLAGLGLTILAQQLAFWPLTIVTAIIFPVFVAVLCALRAWKGKPYKFES